MYSKMCPTQLDLVSHIPKWVGKWPVTDHYFELWEDAWVPSAYYWKLICYGCLSPSCCRSVEYPLPLVIMQHFSSTKCMTTTALANNWQDLSFKQPELAFTKERFVNFTCTQILDFWVFVLFCCLIISNFNLRCFITNGISQSTVW